MHEVDTRVGLQEIAPRALARMRLAGDEKNPKLVAYPVDGNDGAIVDLGELAFQRRRLDLDDIGPGMGNLDADGDIRSDAHIAIFDRLTIAAYRHSGSRWPLALILGSLLFTWVSLVLLLQVKGNMFQTHRFADMLFPFRVFEFALGVALGWLLVRRGLRPLEDIAGTADAITAGDLSRRVEPADEQTEVGRLGLALNTMLGRIESAFDDQRASEERLRRFVADASHELRTPVTTLLGNVEFAARHGADEELLSELRADASRLARLVDPGPPQPGPSRMV